MEFAKNALKVLEKRYLAKDENGNVIETPEEMLKRVAKAVAKADKFYDKEANIEETEKKFFDLMADLRFLPNSPTLMNAGRPLGQLSACFVLPVEDSMEGIFDSIKNAALIHKSGGGTGFSFSRLRPKGSKVKTTGGVASGPVSFMKVFNSATEAVKQGGCRRGANMAILRVDHPDILEFIKCKEDNSEITNFNISVALTEKFMEAAIKGEDYELIDPHTNQVKGKLNAKEVFDLIVNMAWTNGEPGIVFIDRMNEKNPTPNLGEIESTNPCLHGDTLISTKFGLVKISELYDRFKGEEVEIYTDNRVLNEGYGVTLRKAKVLKTGVKKTLKLTLSNGQLLKLTQDHKVLTTNGWKEAGNLDLNDYVLINNGEGEEKISKVKNIIEAEETEVYDISEPITNSLIANGIVVHNCGEQPLLPFESCNLGSINLVKMVKKVGDKYEIDYELLEKTIIDAVHFLDNVIDVNVYPLPEIERMTKLTRKIGLGIMGFADLLILLGIPYNSEEAVNLADNLMRFINEKSKEASKTLAKQRGPFPEFYNSIYKDGEPLRNATTTTIAPTGTISIIAGVSSGIEPIFAVAFWRNVMDNEKLAEVHYLFEKMMKDMGLYSKELMDKVAEEGTIQHIDGIPEDIKRVFVTAHDINPIYHIRMQAAFQKWTDNAVSKTVNFKKDATVDDVRTVYLLAYKLGCKGVTIYRDGSREGQVINVGEEKKEEDVSKPRIRPEFTMGITEKVRIGCGNLYVTVNYDENGICEVFTNLGKAGGCPSQSEATARLVSIALRSGMDVKEIIEQLKGIRCHSTLRQMATNKDIKVLSCPDAIAKTIEKLMNLKEFDKVKESISADLDIRNLIEVDKKEILCPECGHSITHEGGCVICPNCGYSKCG